MDKQMNDNDAIRDPTRDTYDKTIGGTYSPEWLLHISTETHGTVYKHSNTETGRLGCPYCRDD